MHLINHSQASQATSFSMNYTKNNCGMASSSDENDVLQLSKDLLCPGVLTGLLVQSSVWLLCDSIMRVEAGPKSSSSSLHIGHLHIALYYRRGPLSPLLSGWSHLRGLSWCLD